MTNRKITALSVTAALTLAFFCTACSPRGEIAAIDEIIEEIEEAEEGSGEDYDEHEMLEFIDAHDEMHYARLQEDAAMHPYTKASFISDGDSMRYKDSKYESRLGIDVAKYQGNIDWDKVKNAGYDFAFIRIGYRGYGREGTLNEDSMFASNYAGATEAGMDVGVYFFAQAINEEEAIEEAEYVLKLLGGRKLSLPIVYDPESILDDEARTDGVSGEQFTKNTSAFCKRIRKAGYTPAVYANMVWEAYNLDMELLKDETFWYADYQPQPQTPYDFKYWQYSCTGKVPGIEGDCDLNIELIEK